MGPKIRIALFGVGILALFGVLLRTLYLESAVIAKAYEVRKMQDEEARLKNNNSALSVDVAFRRNYGMLKKKALKMGMKENAVATPVFIGPLPKGN